MKLPPDFREPLEAFASEGVECVVVGGYAFAFHARPRATNDLDVLIRGTDDDRARVARALTRFGAPAHVVEAARSMRENEVVYLGSPPLRVDILRMIDGVQTSDVLRNAVGADWDGLPVRVIALEDLLANKRAAARPQDLADVAVLEQVATRRDR